MFLPHRPSVEVNHRRLRQCPDLETEIENQYGMVRTIRCENDNFVLINYLQSSTYTCSLLSPVTTSHNLLERDGFTDGRIPDLMLHSAVPFASIVIMLSVSICIIRTPVTHT